jgi:TonB family protein
MKGIGAALVRRHLRGGRVRIQDMMRLFVLVLLTALPTPMVEPVVARQSATAPPKSGESTRQPVGAIELLTPTEGVDFNSYLHDLYMSIKTKWRASMPPSVRVGQRGVNIVQFRVLQDGTVPDEFLKLRQNSENKDLDDASLGAIRKAAPFSHLPKDFSQPFIELRMSFYYNVDPPKPVPPVAITILRSSAKS